MPLFITYASYSHSGVKGLVNKPEDRSGAVKALIEKAGGKLVALYNTTGSNDVVLVSELADGSDVVAMGMAVAGTDPPSGSSNDCGRLSGEGAIIKGEAGPIAQTDVPCSE